jgi:glycosyltransferase involved in cell wall biosynthesis
MTRALAISLRLPVRDNEVHGMFQRLDVAMRALTSTFERVEYLCIDRLERKQPPGELRDWEARLRERWGANLSLSRAVVHRRNRAGGPLRQTARGVVDYRYLDPFSSIDFGLAAEALREALARGPDVVFAHRLSVMGALLELPAESVTAPVVFDLDDVEHVAMRRRLLARGVPARERLKLLQLGTLLRAQRRALQLARLTLVCSESDRRLLERRFGVSSVRTLPNSVPIPTSAAPLTGSHDVLFVGSFDYAANVTAVEYLVAEVWPLVRRAVPDARLRIVGNRPDRVPCHAAAPPDVVFTGFVPDLAGEYERAAVVCCPILTGSGTRVKIIEAAAHGRAVVSTPLGAEGLVFRDVTEIRIAQGAPGLATACIELLEQPEMAWRIGLAARERARSCYERGAVTQQLEQLFQDLLDLDRGNLGAATLA